MSLLDIEITACSRQEQLELRGLILSYLFKAASLHDLRTYVMERGIGFEVRGFANRIRSDAHLLKNTKVYVYGAHADASEFAPRRCGIGVGEARSLMNIVQNTPKLQRHLKKMVREHYTPMSVDTLDRLCGRVVASNTLAEYMGKFVHKKMAFLISSYGLSADDLKSDLRMSALYALYRGYPQYHSPLHVLNIAKQAIHNRGINIIQENTAQSRNRLITEGAGKFSATNVSLADMPEEITSYVMVGRSGRYGDNDELSDTRFAFDELNDHLQDAPKKKRFLLLLRGHYDQEFSDFLGVESNEDVACDKEFAYTFAKACQFLNIPPEQGEQFVHSLRRVL